jgi:hypothetical protein
VLSATGCAPEVRVPWVIELGATAPSMAYVIVERRAGDCAGPPREQRVLTRAEALAGAMDDVSVQTSRGPAGFAANVIDAACQQIGSGCVDLTLGPGQTEIRVDVQAEAPSRCGPACPVAACRTTDAGALDALGADASGGQLEASVTDAGVADAFVSPLECHAAARDEPECAGCGGVWCGAICCPAEFVCCNDMACRYIDCTGTMFMR